MEPRRWRRWRSGRRGGALVTKVREQK
jgi:hypothetical protein